MAHRHLDPTALVRATFRDKLRRRRRSTSRRGISSNHHRNEAAVVEQSLARDRA
ncbi:MAG TPA: hypothetical protein VGC78_01445 [Gaiellaceae bacterium]